GELDGPSERRRLAGVLLSRHLRQRSGTTTGTQVCVRPIPSEIYRLFLADTQVPPPDADPGILLEATRITVGIRGGDALAFLDWANAAVGGQPSYRLPTVRELDELGAQQRIPALSSGERPDIWSPPETERLGLPYLHRLSANAANLYSV